MFFALSKIFWSLAQPLNFLCVIALLGLIVRFIHKAAGQWMMNGALILIVLLGILPVGPLMLSWLEKQYPPFARMPESLDGIIVLGGAFESHLSQATGQIIANDQIERLFCFMKLAQANPQARLLVSGGAGDILNPDAMEGDDVRAFFALTGFDRGREIIYEEQSRNTYENVFNSRAMMRVSPDETWAVVTSAYHMPRTMGIFRKLEWPVTPYPCDFRTAGAETVWRRLPNVAGNFVQLNLALKEIIGNAVYYLTGKSAFFFPVAPVPSSS